MSTTAQANDTVRASREGHRFHEAWTARKAMQLLVPTDGIVGIAVEGLAEEDQQRAGAGTVEIADLTVYYGRDATFSDADRVEVLQFKYSPKRASKPFRASDAKKTIAKFAESYCDHRRTHGAQAATEKLSFELVTNRPIFPPLRQAINAIARRRLPTANAKTQADQFQKAADLTGDALVEFAAKCRITGLAGTLGGTETELWKILVDWSATTDARAGARLGKMRSMVAKKAGYDARNQKVIRQVDVLDVLGLSEVSDLLPCPESLADVGQVVEREQLTEAASLLQKATEPLIVHADGGIGKTVFLASLATLLSKKHEVVFFDCFGGGAYRSPEDGRHRPQRGLVHIVNVLACRGLCDPVLPGSDNTEVLFARFRKRLAQCVRTLALACPSRRLFLFIDAIDNAAEYADERSQEAFPTLLLESIHRSGPIAGVTIVASGRTHRLKKRISNLLYRGLELRAFTTPETRSYLRARVRSVTDTEVDVAQSRSEGNARILEHLASSDRGLLDPSETDNRIVLDELLNERIRTALGEAIRQGHKEEEIRAFLAGLAVLPPPVPLDEYAGAHGMDLGAIRSFAADLAPLLDRTQQGMTFRDEPTETVVRERYGADRGALEAVAKNLHARQSESAYAAQALPGLLQRLGDGKALFELAFDDRFPGTLNSTVGRRRVRYSRLKAAVVYAATEGDVNRLVRFLVELSTIAASDQRGAKYILENPDLAVNAQDADALRRLFETRTGWPGSRHARLTIANVLAGDADDASRCFTSAVNWIRHDVDSADEKRYNRPRPEHMDRAAIALFFVVQGQAKRALRFMRMWRPWYAFEISDELFTLVDQVIRRQPRLRRRLDALLDQLASEMGVLAGALAFVNPTDERSGALIRKLAKACKRQGAVKTQDRFAGSGRHYEMGDGLRKAAAIAMAHGMKREALGISLRAPHGRPSIWSMTDLHSVGQVFPFLFRVALRGAIKGGDVHECDILPRELAPLAKRLGRGLSGEAFEKRLNKRIEAQRKRERDPEYREQKIPSEHGRDAEYFLSSRLGPLIELTQALAGVLGTVARQADGPFQELVNVWDRVRGKREGYYREVQFNYFFQNLGTEMITFVLWARVDLKAVSIRCLLERLHQNKYLFPSTLIEVIGIIAKRPRLSAIAATEAVRARSLIEKEDEVTIRAGLFAELGRAILPVSADEAAECFRTGLEQLDAIGSGDQEFTAELLGFASEVRGRELRPRDFHTLTNICELNMFSEEEKFPWGIFGTAMSKTSGPQGLAKLSRWHDRDKVDLAYTLLPYLTALVRDGKITGEDAVALNRLAKPVEFWTCNSGAFAAAIQEKNATNTKVLISELIAQYAENNPEPGTGAILKELGVVARDVLGRTHTTTKYLRRVQRRWEEVTGELNEQRNRSSRSAESIGKSTEEARQTTRKGRRLAALTNPLEETSMCQAVRELKEARVSREAERDFFNRLRAKVDVGDRVRYVKLIAGVAGLDRYGRIEELAECRRKWAGSSVGLARLYRSLAPGLASAQAEDAVDLGVRPTYHLKELAELTGVEKSELALEMARVLAASECSVPAAAWLDLASVVCGATEEGHGQAALARLLNSGSGKLAAAVVDGPWKEGLYPEGETSAVAAGLVWQLLGAARASDRWRAAHSVRCFARLGRWEVLDLLVEKLRSRESPGFGAPELPFYYLHARLWLLIALARVAIDHPVEVGRHHDRFMELGLDESEPHVVMRHFAAQVVLACEQGGGVSLCDGDRERLRNVNVSRLTPRSGGGTRARYGDFYRGRPEDAPRPDDRFALDYDFDKYDVHGLAGVFDRPGWAVGDLVGEEVRRIDLRVASMHEERGRTVPGRRGAMGLTSGFHVYGQYVAWHGLRTVAGRLLSRYPVAEGGEDGEEWAEWLSGKCLARGDGTWLADGMDRPPLAVYRNVLEMDGGDLVLTGSEEKLMSLVGIRERRIGREVVVQGDWKSPDGVDVHVSSALVSRAHGRTLAAELLAEEEAFFVWLPTLEFDGDEGGRGRRGTERYEAWIVTPRVDGSNLEEYDPLSVRGADLRPRFVARIVEHYGLKPADAFGRCWRGARGRWAATTDVWGYEMPQEERGASGTRLVCRSGFLWDVLEWKKAELILLVKLSRYESRIVQDRKSRFSTTVAVVRVRGELECEYFAGPVNEVKEVA